MSASYWIAKYIDDPFRNEPRNVGVIVSLNGAVAARFVGERDDGTFDARKLGKLFSHPAAYAQWREFWRTKIRARDIDAIVKAVTPNYYVQIGGEVTDTGSDDHQDVCQFLYNLVIGEGVVQAFDWADAEDTELDLASEIANLFVQSELLDSENLLTPHPVRKGERVFGRHVMHTPSFSQRNGRLYVIEHIDMSSRRQNKVKERAGWMAYMFADIKGYERDAQAYSIVRPERESGSEQIAYARAVLHGESTLVNWADENERNSFLHERSRVARSMNN